MTASLTLMRSGGRCTQPVKTGKSVSDVVWSSQSSNRPSSSFEHRLETIKQIGLYSLPLVLNARSVLRRNEFGLKRAFISLPLVFGRSFNYHASAWSDMHLLPLASDFLNYASRRRSFDWTVRLFERHDYLVGGSSVCPDCSHFTIRTNEQ